MKRGQYLVPALFGLLVLVLSVTLLTVFARSPYTHANLDSAYSDGYSRTQQVTVGTPVPYAPPSAAKKPAKSAGPVVVGRQLFTANNCASCHGQSGQGGTFAPPIAGFDAATLKQRTHAGPGGMPAYSGQQLTPDQLDAIAAFLQSVGKAQSPNTPK